MRKLKLIFVIPCLLVFLASCSSSKGEGGYSASDYADMVDYLCDAVEELDVINRTADPSDVQQTMYLYQQLVREYPDVKEYLTICRQAIADQNPKLLEEANDAKLSEVMYREARGWFNQW